MGFRDEQEALRHKLEALTAEAERLERANVERADALEREREQARALDKDRAGSGSLSIRVFLALVVMVGVGGVGALLVLGRGDTGPPSPRVVRGTRMSWHAWVANSTSTEIRAGAVCGVVTEPGIGSEPALARVGCAGREIFVGTIADRHLPPEQAHCTLDRADVDRDSAALAHLRCRDGSLRIDTDRRSALLRSPDGGELELSIRAQP